MTYVTCPIPRYHPAVVAPKAATMQILYGGRFRLGLGAGENLNEHVVVRAGPRRGRYFDIESALLWDRPDARVPIAVAVSGKDSCTLAGHEADAMIATEPKPELGEMFDAAGGSGKPRIGQIAVCYDTEVAIVQIGAEQQEPFIRWAERELLPALRALSATSRP